MPLPKKGVAYDFPVQLTDIGDPSQFVTNPTIDVGDFKISLDYGSFVNLTTTPTVSPAGSKSVRIDVSAAEMDSPLGKVHIDGTDQAGDQWRDIAIFIDVPTGSVETLVYGVIFTNAPGGFPVQIKDVNEVPIVGKAVTVERKLDDGVFVGASGTATNTDDDGWSFVNYTTADVNGTSSVVFKFTAPGAKDTYLPFKLST